MPCRRFTKGEHHERKRNICQTAAATVFQNTKNPCRTRSQPQRPAALLLEQQWRQHLPQRRAGPLPHPRARRSARHRLPVHQKRRRLRQRSPAHDQPYPQPLPQPSQPHPAAMRFGRHHDGHRRERNPHGFDGLPQLRRYFPHPRPLPDRPRQRPRFSQPRRTQPRRQTVEKQHGRHRFQPLQIPVRIRPSPGYRRGGQSRIAIDQTVRRTAVLPHHRPRPRPKHRRNPQFRLPHPQLSDTDQRSTPHRSERPRTRQTGKRPAARPKRLLQRNGAARRYRLRRHPLPLQ